MSLAKRREKAYRAKKLAMQKNCLLKVIPNGNFALIQDILTNVFIPTRYTVRSLNGVFEQHYVKVLVTQTKRGYVEIRINEKHTSCFLQEARGCVNGILNTLNDVAVSLNTRYG